MRTSRTILFPVLRAALVIAFSLTVAGCTSPACPDPEMANPASATWGPIRRAFGPDGGLVGVTSVVVRWSPKAGDPLPDAYYGKLELGRTPTPAGLVASAKQTASHEVSVDVRDLDTFLKTSTHLELPVALPDPRGSYRCSHAGGPDSFAVPLSLDFDVPGHSVSATFGTVVARRGACAVGAIGHDSVPFASVWLVAATAMLRLLRRCRRREPIRKHSRGWRPLAQRGRPRSQGVLARTRG
jgi:hypothetical protein